MSSWMSLRNRLVPPSRKNFKDRMDTMEYSMTSMNERACSLIKTNSENFGRTLEFFKQWAVTSPETRQKTGFPSLDCGWGEKCHARLKDKNFEIIVHKYIDRYVSEALRQSQVWEHYESSLLYQIVQNYKHDFIINIGANIGWYALLCGKIVGEQGKVLAVEPDPYNYMLLTDNIRLNGLNATVSALNIGMGEKEYQGTLYLSQDNFGDHRTYYDGMDRNRISVGISSLDQLSRQWKSYPDIVVMDTQGAEEVIFAGARECFSNGWNPLVFFEFCPSMSPDKGKSLIQIVQSWEKYTYTFYSILAMGESVEKISLEDMAAFADMTRNDDTEHVRFLDLIAIPGEVSLESLLDTE